MVTTTLAPRGRGERDRPRRPRDERGDGGRRDGGRDGERRDRRPRDGDDGARRGRPAAGGGGDRRDQAESKSRLKRLRPGRAHRRELIAELPEEQRPIAEELAKGGIPGVRAALDAQNAQAKAEGKPEINPAPLLALAEELWPRMRTAEWRDRAEAAIAEVDELDLRDLRSVVVAADSAARDDESRALAVQLREALGRRVDEEHSRWLTELAELVAENRIVAALRRSSRPPKAGAPLPSDLAQLLADGTSESLHAEAGTERWSVLLDALSFSPVRSSVTPASVPEHPSDELLNAVRRAAPRLPQIAALFGIEAAPAPPPGRAGRRPAGAGSGRGGAGQRRGEKPIPAPPTLPADEAATATADRRRTPATPLPPVAMPIRAEPVAEVEAEVHMAPSRTVEAEATRSEHRTAPEAECTRRPRHRTPPGGRVTRRRGTGRRPGGRGAHGARGTGRPGRDGQRGRDRGVCGRAIIRRRGRPGRRRRGGLTGSGRPKAQSRRSSRRSLRRW